MFDFDKGKTCLSCSACFVGVKNKKTGKRIIILCEDIEENTFQVRDEDIPEMLETHFKACENYERVGEEEEGE